MKKLQEVIDNNLLVVAGVAVDTSEVEYPVTRTDNTTAVELQHKIHTDSD